ncbi:hypothetical protein D9M68_884700 [compost metagenome]
MLDRRGVERVGQFGQHGLARGAVVVEHADLDEAVRLERGIGFLAHGGGQAVVADVDHGVEVVGLGAVNLALGGRERNGGHGRIIDHPRRAARDPLKGAALAARQSRFRGARGWGHFSRCGGHSPC